MSQSQVDGEDQEAVAPYVVIEIESSGEGLEACKTILSGLSKDVGFAVIVVANSDSEHDVALLECLAASTPLAVELAIHGEGIEPCRVYLVPPDVVFFVEKGVFSLKARRDVVGEDSPNSPATDAELNRIISERTSELRQATMQSEKREQQAVAVARLSDLIYENKDLEQLYEMAIDEIHRILEVEIVALYRHRSDQERLFVLCAKGLDAEVRALRIGTSVVRYVRGTGQSVCFSDFSTDNRFEPTVLKGEPDLVSGVVTPIPKAKDFFGVLGAYDQQDREFTTNEIDFIETVAYVLGTALARSEDRFLNALDSAVASTLAAGSNLQNAIEGVRETLIQELEASVCELWLSKPDDVGLYRATSHIPGAETEPSVEGLVEAVWESGEPLWITDLGLHEEYSLSPRASDLGLVGGFAFPLQSGEGKLGVVTCYFSHSLFSSRRTLAGLKVAGFSLGEFVRRTRAEVKLQESEERLHQALKAVPFPLCILTETGEFVLVSDALYDLTGYEPAQIQSVEDFSKLALRDPDRAGDILRFVRGAASLDEINSHGITSVWTADGEKMFWDFTTAPLGRSLQGARTLVAVGYDITEQERVRRELLEVARHKDEFLAMLGHELRNPLAGIRSGIQLMLMAETEEDNDEALGIIDRQSSQMVFLIDGLLDLNRIARGKVSLSPQPVNITKLAALAVRDKLPGFREKGLTLSFQPAASPVWALGDPTRLLQVIDNLLSNSLKFTDEPGAVVLSLTALDDQVQIRVKDTGHGLDKELAAVIFEPFLQGEQSLSRPTGGLGLGLSLVKLIIELHGGAVSVYSEGLGKGSEFLVTLPACEAQEEAEPEVLLSSGPWGVLYIEDSPELGKSLSRILRSVGHQVRHAIDGETALRMIDEFVPDIILCDVGLPGQWDGYSLVQKLQENPALSGVPLVAVTGYGLQEDRVRSQAAGFWEHLTKPVELSAIESLLRRFVHPHKDEPKLPREDFCRVLVVDDNKIVARGTAMILSKAGFQVECAYSASEALLSAKEHLPHIALLDLGLSDTGGGIALKKELAACPGLQGCVYFALTGSDTAEDRKRTAENGFAAHLVKPASLERLLFEMKRVVASQARAVELRPSSL